ncbi:MAG: peptidylprolyl isomerase [Planctomycetota bacterium]
MTPLRNLVLVGVLACSLASCGDDSATKPANPPANPTEKPDVTPEAPKANPTDPQSPLQELARFAEAQKVDKAKQNWKFTLPKPPKVAFAAGHDYFWNLATNVGNIKIKLMPSVAPMHVSSTIYLTQLGFYDGLPFHRVITDFMAQGGDPRGNGSGGPGYQYAGEFDKKVRHDRPGLLSMANAGAGTDGSQFFITFKPTSWLDDKHTIFGEVVEGMEAVRRLESFGSARGETSQQLLIERATITVQ